MIKKFTISSIDSLVQDLIEKTRINSGGALTKFTKNSVTRGLLYAFSSQLAYTKGYLSSIEARRFLSTCYASDLDTYASEYYGEQRRGASKSSAEVFVKASPGTIYPAGQQFSSISGVTFLSKEQVILDKGLPYAFIQVESQDYGAFTKVYANTITSCRNAPAGHESVTNFSPAIGGFDEESDEEFRARLYSIPQRVCQQVPYTIESLAYSLFPELGKCYCQVSSYGMCYLGVLKNSGMPYSDTECLAIKTEIQKYLGYANSINLDVRPLKRINITVKADVTVTNSADFQTVFEEIQIKLLSYLEPRFYSDSRIRGELVLSKLSEIEDITDIDQATFSLMQDIRTPKTTIPFIKSVIINMKRESGEERTFNQEIPDYYYSLFNPNVTSNLKEVL